jgi:flavin-dependent dehydrogenase
MKSDICAMGGEIGKDKSRRRRRRRLFEDKKTIDDGMHIPETYIAIQEWFEYPESIPYYTAFFDEEISDFYSWLIPKGNHMLLGSALRPGETAGKMFGVLKTKLIEQGFFLGKNVRTEGAYIYRPKKPSQFYAGRENIALVGEAAGAISPSSAEGISYALKSSLYLARSLEGGLDGFLSRYKRKAMDIRLNLCLKNLKSPAMYHPPFRRLIMKSGLNSITHQL